MVHHPDRHSGATEDEKKDHEHKFKEVCMCRTVCVCLYECLCVNISVRVFFLQNLKIFKMFLSFNNVIDEIGILQIKSWDSTSQQVYHLMPPQKKGVQSPKAFICFTSY